MHPQKKDSTFCSSHNLAQHRRCLTAVLCLVFYFASTTTLFAQPTDYAQGEKRALYEKGVSFLERHQYDSVLHYLLPVINTIDPFAIIHQVDLELQGAVAAAWIKQNKRKKAIKLLLELWRKSNQAESWSVATEVSLSLGQLYQELNQPEESHLWMSEANRIVSQQELRDKEAALAIRFAGWHSQYGYNDSVRSYAQRALIQLEGYDFPDQLACAHTLLGRSLEEGDYEASVSEQLKAVPILRSLGDFVTLSDRLHRVTLIYYRAGSIRRALMYNDSTISACYAAIKADMPESDILSGAYLLRGRAYRRLNQLDSALYYARKGYTEEIRYLRNQERAKILEVAEQFKNEEQIARIREQDQLLRFQRFRLTGVLIFTSLIILLSVVLIYFYSRLTKSHSVNLRQGAEIRQANQQLKDSLDRQTMLQSEIHHRVKNNLQVIISLLELQKLELTDAQAVTSLEAMSGRIFSMAALHDLLYLKDGEEVVDVQRYTRKLCDYVSSMLRSGVPKFDLKIPSVLFNLETLMPLGIILNELLTNSFKYAHQPGRELKISVSLRELDDGKYEFTYRDNGPGFPAESITHREGGLGKYLLENMTEQLRGNMVSGNDDGATVRMEFHQKVTSSVKGEIIAEAL